MVIIHENIIKCANNYLNIYIVRIAKRYSNSIWKNMKKERRVSLLSSNKINMIYNNYSIYLLYDYHTYNILYEFKKKITYFIFNSVKVIQ